MEIGSCCATLNDDETLHSLAKIMSITWSLELFEGKF